MAFKRLGDKHRSHALIPFLQMAHNLRGHLVGLAVTKDMKRLSTSASSLEALQQRRSLKGNWNQTSLEAMVRTAHLMALLMSLWSRPGMNVTWITDQDEIAANEHRLDDVHQIAARLCGMYIPHKLGIFAMNTTAIDQQSREYEDLLAIPDLAAGMLAEVASQIAANGRMEMSRTHLDAERLSVKCDTIADWFWWPHSNLRRTCILLDNADNGRFRTTKIDMLQQE